MANIEGLHHVTAIAGDPQTNINFYTGVLGLRLVKLTVNFDDPTTYHLYYGDGQGHPGTIMTFFPWPGAFKGRIGTGQLTVTSFAVPEKSLPYWRERLRKCGVEVDEATSDFGEELLFLKDPDGLQLELVSTSNANPDSVWERGPVPTEHAVRGLHHVTLSENGHERTASLLTQTLGFEQIAKEGNHFRYAVGNNGPSAIVDLVRAPEERPGRVAVGTVHHVAWRTATNAEQVQWRDTLTELNYNVTPIIDRQYFHSIYFREPGGVLFEIATDPPGFATDETVERLGTSLKLPPWLEEDRPELERLLPRVELPGIDGGKTMKPPKDLGFVHVFVRAEKPKSPTLLLLHGTGGDERDLLPLGRELWPGAALLGVRGKVLENGMPRFFRRFAEGVFDVDDLKTRTNELAEFIDVAAQHYGFSKRHLLAVGYSNGANIAASLILLHPHYLAAAVLFRAMVPFTPDMVRDFRALSVFLAGGMRDAIVPREQTEQLAAILESGGADVVRFWHRGGHELGEDDMQAAKKWLEDKFSNGLAA